MGRRGAGGRGPEAGGGPPHAVMQHVQDGFGIRGLLRGVIQSELQHGDSVVYFTKPKEYQSQINELNVVIS